MKFQKLTIHNLASIEDATIDFEHGPLADDSRFLICGPTGAGKTTILDAICLVLYGTTPRLNIKKVEAYVDQFENFKLKDRIDIKIDDTRMLMRRGSLSAFVELIFTDKDDRSLKAVWQCSRVHNKVQGNVKEPDWLLFDTVTDTLISEKKSTTLKEIGNRIGLTFDQFCRTTMLAQGDFTKFLKSDEGEKSQILERLTGTDIYSEISMKIHQTKVQKEVICQQIESKMDGVQLLSSDEKVSIEQQKNDLLKKLECLKEEESNLTNKLLWYNKLNEFIKLKDKAFSQLNSQLEQERSVTFKDEQKLLEDWQNTQEQRDLLNKRKEAESAILRGNQEVQNTKELFVHLTGGLMGLTLKLEEKKRIQEKIKNYLTQEEANEERYKNISVIQLLVKQLNEITMQVDESVSTMHKREEKRKELSLRYGEIQGNVNKFQNLIQDKDKDIVASTLRLETLNYVQLLQERNEEENRLSNLKDYRQLVEQHTHTVEDFQYKSKNISELNKSIVSYTQKVTKAQEASSALEMNVHQQLDVFHKQERACNNVMKEYRSLLHEGDTCPLCGQVVSHLETDQHFISLLQPLKELVDTLQEKLKIAQGQLSEYKAQLSLYITELPKREQELQLVTQQINQIAEKIQAHVVHTTFASYDNPLPIIDQSIRETGERLKGIITQLSEVGVEQQKLNSFQKDKDLLEKSLHQSELRLQEIEKQQSILREANIQEQTSLQKARVILEEKQAELGGMIDMNRYQQEGFHYIDILKQGAEHYQVANEKAISVETHIQEINHEINLVNQVKDKILRQRDDWQALSSGTPCMIEHLSDAWMELQTKVSRATEALHIAEGQFKQYDKSLNNYLSQPGAISPQRLQELSALHVDELVTLRNKHQQSRDLHVKLATQFETADQNLSSHLQSKPADEQDTDIETLNRLSQSKKEEINACNQLVGKLIQSLEIDAKNHSHYAVIHKQFEEATEESNRWTHLHKLFGSNDGKKFRNIAQSFVLEQLLANANEYLHQFTNRYEMECQPGSLTILLRDKEAGGVMRPTTTISGGESFLISLSLALGLSSLSRTSLSMDTLFIDEGFGTLDSTYLSSVMDALERLHQIGGKKIGIISHVESLKERLTTQIQVSRINNTLSKVDVVSLL